MRNPEIPRNLAETSEPTKQQIAMSVMLASMGFGSAEAQAAKNPIGAGATALEMALDKNADVLRFSAETLLEATIDRTTEEGQAEAEETINRAIEAALECIDGSAEEKFKQVIFIAENIKSAEGIVGAAELAKQCTDLDIELDILKQHPKWDQRLKDVASIGTHLVVGNRTEAAEKSLGMIKAGAIQLRVVKLSKEGGEAMSQIDAETGRIESIIERIANASAEELQEDALWDQSFSFGTSKDIDPSDLRSIREAMQSEGLSIKNVLEAQGYSLGYSIQQTGDGASLQFNGSVLASREGRSFSGIAGYVEGGISKDVILLGKEIGGGGLVGYGTDGVEAGGYLQIDSGGSAVKAITTVNDKGDMGTRLVYQVQFGKK